MSTNKSYYWRVGAAEFMLGDCPAAEELHRLADRVKELEAEGRGREREALSFWRTKAVTNDHALAEWEEWLQEQKKRRAWDRFMNIDSLGALVLKREVLDLRQELAEWEEWFAQVDEVTYREDGDEGGDAAIGESLCIGVDPGAGDDQSVEVDQRRESWEEYCARTGTSLTDTGAYFRNLASPNPRYAHAPTVGDHSAAMEHDDVEASPWRPIATAPMDGKWILGLNNRFNCAVIIWDKKLEAWVHPFTSLRPSSFWNGACGSTATHWMPLPKPTAAEGWPGGRWAHEVDDAI